jgi:hypothetical protein
LVRCIVNAIHGGANELSSERGDYGVPIASETADAILSGEGDDPVSRDWINAQEFEPGAQLLTISGNPMSQHGKLGLRANAAEFAVEALKRLVGALERLA